MAKIFGVRSLKAFDEGGFQRPFSAAGVVDGSIARDAFTELKPAKTARARGSFLHVTLPEERTMGGLAAAILEALAAKPVRNINQGG